MYVAKYVLGGSHGRPKLISNSVRFSNALNGNMALALQQHYHGLCLRKTKSAIVLLYFYKCNNIAAEHKNYR